MTTELELVTMLAKQSMEQAKQMIDQDVDPDFLIGYLMGTLQATVVSMEGMMMAEQQTMTV